MIWQAFSKRLVHLKNGGTIQPVTRPFPRHSRIRQTVQPCRGRL